MGRPRKQNQQHLPKYVYRRKGGVLWYEPPGKEPERLGVDDGPALQEWYRLQNDGQGEMGKLILDALNNHRKLKLHTAHPLSDNTWDQYLGAAHKLGYMMQKCLVAAVDAHVIGDVMEKLSATPNMANRCLTVLRITFKYAVRIKLAKTNPAVGTVDRYEEFKRKRRLTAAEFARIYAKAPPRMKVIMLLCLKSGRRIMDVLTIRLDQLVEDGIYFKESKEGHELILGWDAELRDIVERAKQLRGRKVGTLTLFVNRNGKTPDYRSTHLQWQTACERAGVEDAHIHDLRAMAITEMKKQGGDSKAFSAHKSEAMHDRYLRDQIVPVVGSPSVEGVLGRVLGFPKKPQKKIDKL